VGNSNAVEAYLEKRAGFFGDVAGGARGAFKGENVGKGLAGIAATGAASLGVLAVQKAYDAATKAKDFKSMLEYAPDVMQMHQEDPKAVSQMFSTLRVFNPDFTRDPVVASSYVRRMVGEPTGAGGIATEALQSRDKMRHPLADRMMSSALGGGKKK
jgi:hypothetical protein